MDVILREDIDKLGVRGQVVNVATGFARNFLLPKKLAVAATESNKKIVEQERQAHLRKETKLKSEAEDLGKMMAGVSVTIRLTRPPLSRASASAGSDESTPTTSDAPAFAACSAKPPV